MNNGSISSADILGHDLRSLLLDLSNNENELMEYFKKYNFRRIQVRCLSDILQANSALSCISNEVQQFSWSTCFNADCTFSLVENENPHSTMSVRKCLHQRMIELDGSLYEAYCGYRGFFDCYLFTAYMHLSYIYI